MSPCKNNFAPAVLKSTDLLPRQDSRPAIPAALAADDTVMARSGIGRVKVPPTLPGPSPWLLPRQSPDRALLLETRNYDISWLCPGLPGILSCVLITIVLHYIYIFRQRPAASGAHSKVVFPTEERYEPLANECKSLGGNILPAFP